MIDALRKYLYISFSFVSAIKCTVEFDRLLVRTLIGMVQCPKAGLQPYVKPGNVIKVLENAYILGYYNHLKY